MRGRAREELSGAQADRVGLSIKGNCFVGSLPRARLVGVEGWRLIGEGKTGTKNDRHQ